MEAQQIEVSLEEFKCRIPALFPYIEWNPDGTTETHLATDAPNGSYGRIVDNMKIPAGVRLTSYMPVLLNQIPEVYQWNDGNTVGLYGDLTQRFSVSGVSYLRKAVWYAYVPTDEDIPEAEELDELPENVEDDSPEFIKIPLTDYNGNPLVCGATTIYQYYSKYGEYRYYERVDIIKPCKTYSYRTIINSYYKYKDIVGETNSFIQFVERGVGLVVVDRFLLNLEDVEKYPEVPEFVYLSQVKSLKSKYDTLRSAYNHYQTYYLANGKESKTLAEKAEKYERMGGDNMRNWLGQMVQKAYDIADYYKCRADNKEFPLRLGINLMLLKHTAVVGLETVFENVFTPGNRYYDGDLLTYDGRTYICKLDRLIPGSENNYQYIRKVVEVDGVYVKGTFILDGDGYLLVSNSNITYVSEFAGVPDERVTDFIVADSQWYRWDEETQVYHVINVREYSTGVWDYESERYVFDSQHFVLLSELENHDEWYDSENLDGDKLKYFVDMDYIPSYRIHDYISFNGNIFAWNDDDGQYVATDGNENAIAETTNSKLVTLRGYREYIDGFGNVEEPGVGEDWLWYYKVGKISGKVIETDSLGNIVSDSEDFTGTCYDLHAYGNTITSITFDNNDNTITFKYVIGGHLIADADYSESDIDGNVIRYYTNFRLDEDSGDGVLFTETHRCVGDSIRSLGSRFNAYVDGNEEVMDDYMYEKFPFETIPVVAIDGSVSVEGSGIASFEANGNMIHSATVREDWMNGLWFQPKVKSDISIDRGNGASFDRHIRLGEIHTMEDMVNYQNGGFFRLSQS